MPVYAYDALNDLRTPVRGVVSADTPRAARALLRGRGLAVRRVEPHDARAGRAKGQRPAAGLGLSDLPFRRRIDPGRVTDLVRELATLLAVGVPLTEALAVAARGHPGRLGTVLLAVRDRVAAGSTLAAALAEHPRAFDELCLRVVEVGEASGTLDAALLRLGEHRERGRQLRGRLVTAVLYPLIVVATAVVVSIFLMTFVVPNILRPLEDMGRPLPLPTRVVKGASDLLIGWWWLLAAAAAFVAFAGGWIYRTRRGRRLCHGLVLRLPVIGDLARKQAVVQIAVAVSTLMRSGVAFVGAVATARRATGNVVLAEALGRCERAVTAGGDIGAALERTGAFPPVVVQVFAVGQQSGRLEEMLDRMAGDYDAHVAAASARLAALLEPALILLLALLVGTIALATMLPILEAGDVLG